MLLENIINWHLQFNHFPPKDTRYALPCAAAVRNCRVGRRNALIQLDDSKTMPSWEIVNFFELTDLIRSGHA